MKKYLIAAGVGLLLIAGQTAFAAASGAMAAQLAGDDDTPKVDKQARERLMAELQRPIEGPAGTTTRELPNGAVEEVEIKRYGNASASRTVTVTNPDGTKHIMETVINDDGDMDARESFYSAPDAAGKFNRTFNELDISASCMAFYGSLGSGSKCIEWNAGSGPWTLPSIAVSTWAFTEVADELADKDKSPS